jgi:hypothetical protein
MSGHVFYSQAGREQREYVNMAYFNQSSKTQYARYSTTLLKPLFSDPDHWKTSINRAVIPLQGMPLTANNIPYKAWQVGLGYFSGTSRTTVVNYVPQYNEVNIDNTNSSDFIGTDLIVNAKYSSTPNASINFQVSAQLATYTAYDTYTTEGTIYGFNGNNVYAVSATSGKLLYTWTMTSPVGTVTADISTGNVYISTNDANYTTYQYVRSGNTAWTLGNNYVVPSSTGYNGYRAGMFYNGYFYAYLTGDGNYTLFVGVLVSASTAFTFLDSLGTNGQFLTQLITNQTNGFVYAEDNFNNLQRYTLNALNNIPPTQNTLASNLPAAGKTIGFDTSGNIIISVSYFSNPVLSVYTTTGSFAYNLNDPVYSTSSGAEYSSFVIPSPSISVAGGSYELWTYQDYLEKINDALATTFNSIKTSVGAGYQPTEAPFVFYDPTTGLFGLNCEGFYLTPDEYQIYMNETLYDKFYFPAYSTSPDPAYPDLYQIVVENYGINAVIGDGSATLPQFVNMYQESGTRQRFFDLTRILFSTTRIPVSGDAEAQVFDQDGTPSNSTINLITDIVPDTSTLDNTATIIYIPAGILRWYNLYAQQPFTILDLQVYYETKDGLLHQLQILPGDNFSVKLEFKRSVTEY